MKYTREQLVKAQQKYNKEYIKNPIGFTEEINGSKEEAERQIDFLLQLIDYNVA